MYSAVVAIGTAETVHRPTTNSCTTALSHKSRGALDQ